MFQSQVHSKDIIVDLNYRVRWTNISHICVNLRTDSNPCSEMTGSQRHDHTLTHPAQSGDTMLSFPYYSQQVFIGIPLMLPYDSPIFVSVQSGNIDLTRSLLTSGQTPIEAVDPYGLGLLYVSFFNVKNK